MVGPLWLAKSWWVWLGLVALSLLLVSAVQPKPFISQKLRICGILKRGLVFWWMTVYFWSYVISSDHDSWLTFKMCFHADQTLYDALYLRHLRHWDLRHLPWTFLPSQRELQSSVPMPKVLWPFCTKVESKYRTPNFHIWDLGLCLQRSFFKLCFTHIASDCVLASEGCQSVCDLHSILCMNTSCVDRGYSCSCCSANMLLAVRLSCRLL